MNTPSDELIVGFARRLAETNHKWRNELDLRLGPLGLSQARGVILHYLSIHGDGLQQNELADIVGIRGSTLVRQLDRLEADGWVERRNDPDDRRAKTIHLSSKAGPMVLEIQKIIEDLRHEFLSGLSDAQLATCFTVFDHIQERIDQSAGAADHARATGND
ncbi:MAG: MarR family transcriptional regulator [Alphaproteobacteria bacterium]|nr:MarR family transcriptional regulator [Alphaproteobacteria bacterium]